VRPEVLISVKKYTSNPDFEFEKVNRASVACGPLCSWVKSQILYSAILNKVDPLRSELDRLENDAETKNSKCNTLDQTIQQLEQQIGVYKEEYAQLIAQVESIKSDRSNVQDKVERSIHLLKSLEEESKRWHFRKDNFHVRTETLVGNSVIAGAFLAYSGFFDQQVRESLIKHWGQVLYNAKISY